VLEAVQALPAARNFARWKRYRSSGSCGKDLSYVSARAKRTTGEEVYKSFEEFEQDITEVFRDFIDSEPSDEEAKRPMPLQQWAAELLEFSQNTLSETRKQNQHVLSPSGAALGVTEGQSKGANKPQTGSKSISSKKNGKPPSRWEPVHVFRNNATMPDDLKDEQERGESMVLFFQEPCEWFWIKNSQLREFNDKPSDSVIVCGRIIEHALAEQSIYEHSM
jgi:hypothetical protein